MEERNAPIFKIIHPDTGATLHLSRQELNSIRGEIAGYKQQVRDEQELGLPHKKVLPPVRKIEESLEGRLQGELSGSGNKIWPNPKKSSPENK